MRFFKKISFVILSFIVSAAFILQPLFANAGAEADENAKNDISVLRQHLSDCGCPSEFLNELPDEAIEKICDSTKDYDISNPRVETPHYNNAPRDYTKKYLICDLKDKSSGKVVASHLSILYIDSDSTYLFKRENLFTVLWESPFFYAGDSFFACDMYKKKDSDSWMISNTYKSPAVANQTDIGQWNTEKQFTKSHAYFMSFILSTNDFKNEPENYSSPNFVIQVQTDNQRTVILPISLVLLTAAITVVIIVLIKRKRKTPKHA